MATDRDTFDLVVLGAGAAGLTAAVVAAHKGLDVLVIEKSRYVGGTTAISGGMVWVPDNHLMEPAGLRDSTADARAYLESTVPGATARAALEDYLEHAPEAIRYLCTETEVKLQPVVRYPDYYPDLAGATRGGRVLEPVPFDGGRLGHAFDWLRPPLPEFTILGGMMIARSDIPHFRRFATTTASTLRVLRLLARYARERLVNARGTSLVLGNALAGRLLLSARAAGVVFRRETAVAALIIDNGRCIGVRTKNAGGEQFVSARRGVVVATGGFSHNAALRQQLMTTVADEVSATVEIATGDGLNLATAAGAAIDGNGADPAFWVPVSTYVTAAGRRVVFPHTVTDRAKPGFIAVDRGGRRFVNECVSYHEFVRAMLRSANGSASRAHLICDHRALWRYGLGAIQPFTRRLQPYIAAGYLRRANTVEGLAQQIGVEATTLAQTISRFNTAASGGVDPEFGRGGDDYQRHLGDGDQKPNPCIAPLATPPFYAVEMRPGDLGTAAGLKTDLVGRVLTGSGDPIKGLYAAGNDRASIMQGNYPGPGITLGPALTHGYQIAQVAAAER